MTFDDILRYLYKTCVPYQCYSNAPANIQRVKDAILNYLKSLDKDKKINHYWIVCDNMNNPQRLGKPTVQLIIVEVGAILPDNSSHEAQIFLTPQGTRIYKLWDPFADPIVNTSAPAKKAQPSTDYDRAMKGL